MNQQDNKMNNESEPISKESVELRDGSYAGVWAAYQLEIKQSRMDILTHNVEWYTVATLKTIVGNRGTSNFIVVVKDKTAYLQKKPTMGIISGRTVLAKK